MGNRKLIYFNSFEFFDHTGSTRLMILVTQSRCSMLGISINIDGVSFDSRISACQASRQRAWMLLPSRPVLLLSRLPLHNARYPCPHTGELATAFK